MAPGLDLSVLAEELDRPTPLPVPFRKNPIETTSASPLHGNLVRHPSSITADFDLLRFEAAAFGQLLLPGTTDAHHITHKSDGDPRHCYSSDLISSPYNNPGHYLDLRSLGTAHLIFAKALTALKPAGPDYATVLYTEALNFPDVLDLAKQLSEESGYQWKEQSFYVVVFQSRLKENIDNELLYKLDYESHREACESGGLLKYWFGKCDAERRNLATCFWRSKEDARKGGLGPWHKKARMAVREMYERITFTAFRFTVLDGAESFVLEDWVE